MERRRQQFDDNLRKEINILLQSICSLLFPVALLYKRKKKAEIFNNRIMQSDTENLQTFLRVCHPGTGGTGI